MTEGAALDLLGHLARDQGDLETALALLGRSLPDPPAVPVGIAPSLEGVAGVEAEQGREAKATRATRDLPRSYMTRHVAADRATVRVALGGDVRGCVGRARNLMRPFHPCGSAK